MAATVRKNDVGTVIRLTVKVGNSLVDLSQATVKQIKLEKPDDTVLTKTAVFTTDGKDGKMQYTTATGDLDAAGKWNVQGYIEGAGGKWHTTVQQLEVEENVPLP